MEWTVAGSSSGTDAVESVVFQPSDVYLLSQLSRDLPWLSGLDPYRDRQIAVEELTLAKHDLEAALLRHCLAFCAQYASSNGLSIEDLSRKPGLIYSVAGKLKVDNMYLLLRRAIRLLEFGEEHNVVVKVYGT